MRSRALAALLLVAAAGCGCGGERAPDAGADDGGPDAGRDAGPRDAGPRDGGVDARVDARVDAGWPAEGWRRVEGLGECPIDVALDPSTVIPPLEVTPCPDRAGCRRMDLPWIRSAPSTQIQSGWHDGAHAHLIVGIRIDESQYWLAVIRDDGQVTSVVRGPPISGDSACYAVTSAVGDGRFLLSVRDRSTGRDRAIITAAELVDVGATLEVVGILTAEEMLPNNAPQYVGISRDVIAINLAPRHALIRMENDGSRREVASERLAPDGAQAYLGPVVGPTIVMDRLGAPDRIEVSRPELAGTESLFEPDVEVSSPMFDGTNLSWFRLFGRVDAVEFESVELWTSPWAPGASLAPRRVAELPQYRSPIHGLVSGAGHVIAFLDGAHRIVYRLADGHRALVPALGSTRFPYAGPEEFVMAPQGTERDFYEVPYLDFVRYDSLTFAAP